MKKPATVQINILNWNGREIILDCISAVLDLAWPNKEVVVIDNNSTDGSVELIKRNYPQVTIIRNCENLGFSGGHNVGIIYGLTKGVNYFLLLNNDTRIDRVFLSVSIPFMEDNPFVGIITPRIYDMEMKRLINCGARYIEFFAYPLVRKARKVSGVYDKIEKVSVACGCAMLVKREVFERVGLLNETFFLLYEDADFSLRALKNGFSIYYIPFAKVKHYECYSFKGKYSPLNAYHRMKSWILFMFLHGKWYNAPFFILSVTLCSLIRMFFFLIGRNWESILGTCRGIFDGLKKGLFNTVGGIYKKRGSSM